MTLTCPAATRSGAIAKHPAKVKVLACGRRWGKTVLGGRIVMEVLRQHGRCGLGRTDATRTRARSGAGASTSPPPRSG